MLADSAYKALEYPETKVQFAKLIMRTVNTEEITDGLFNTFVYKPIRNFVGLGTPRKSNGEEGENIATPITEEQSAEHKEQNEQTETKNPKQ